MAAYTQIDGLGFLFLGVRRGTRNKVYGREK